VDVNKRAFGIISVSWTDTNVNAVCYSTWAERSSELRNYVGKPDPVHVLNFTLLISFEE